MFIMNRFLFSHLISLFFFEVIIFLDQLWRLYTLWVIDCPLIYSYTFGKFYENGSVSKNVFMQKWELYLTCKNVGHEKKIMPLCIFCNFMICLHASMAVFVIIRNQWKIINPTHWNNKIRSLTILHGWKIIVAKHVA